MSRVDFVVVYHNETNRRQAHALVETVRRQEPVGDYQFMLVDNRRINRGFAVGCNVGAFHPKARSPVIGFLNPDVEVQGPFIDEVLRVLGGPVVITGCRFGKADRELQTWGVSDWVCGAAFFVDRQWFASKGGFDRRYVWSHEETDLIRQAEAEGKAAKSIRLPLEHHSPDVDSPEDAAYKQRYFAEAQLAFFRKWGR